MVALLTIMPVVAILPARWRTIHIRSLNCFLVRLQCCLNYPTGRSVSQAE